MTKQWPAGWTCFKKIIICRLNRMDWKRIDSSSAGGMGFVYNEDNANLSSAHVKDIAHHSPVKLVLSHQESRCICYPYFHMIGEKTIISLWHNKNRQAELISKRSTKCRPNFTNALKEHFQIFPKVYIISKHLIYRYYCVMNTAIYIRPEWMWKALLMSKVPT